MGMLENNTKLKESGGRGQWVRIVCLLKIWEVWAIREMQIVTNNSSSLTERFNWGWWSHQRKIPPHVYHMLYSKPKIQWDHWSFDSTSRSNSFEHRLDFRQVGKNTAGLQLLVYLQKMTPGSIIIINFLRGDGKRFSLDDFSINRCTSGSQSYFKAVRLCGRRKSKHRANITTSKHKMDSLYCAFVSWPRQSHM